MSALRNRTVLPPLRRFSHVFSCYQRVLLASLSRAWQQRHGGRTTWSLPNLLYRCWTTILSPKRSRFRGLAFAASAAVFSFGEQGITDDEVERASCLTKDMNFHHEQNPSSSNSDQSEVASELEDEDDTAWEMLIDKPDFRMWQRPLKDHPYICEYKCTGSYADTSAMSFFTAQLDLDYRKKWDDMAVELKVVETDPTTGSEIVKWISKFPFPMSPREYIYVRRSCVDYCNRILVVSSRAVEHPAFPPDENAAVRVDVYRSTMVIRPHHGDFAKPGFDYALTYCDDPKAPFPGPVHKWLVNYGIVGFVTNIHTAAKQLYECMSESIHQQTYGEQKLNIG